MKMNMVIRYLGARDLRPGGCYMTSLGPSKYIVLAVVDNTPEGAWCDIIPLKPLDSGTVKLFSPITNLAGLNLGFVELVNARLAINTMSSINVPDINANIPVGAIVIQKQDIGIKCDSPAGAFTVNVSDGKDIRQANVPCAWSEDWCIEVSTDADRWTRIV